MKTMILTKRWRFLILFLLFALLSGLIATKLPRSTLGIDDAYIFMTYGKNLANGHGLVYYPGGERVEGFSSILWMLINALGFAITSQPQWGLLLLNLSMVAFALTHLWIFIDQSSQITWRGVLFIVWVMCTPAYILWVGLPLMDTALWSSCLILATVAVLSPEKSKWLSWLVALLILSRPEGLLWALAFIGIRFLLDAIRGSITGALTTVKKPLLVYFVTVLLLTVGRLLYFGYPLPNTYYAKVSPDMVYNLEQGAVYLFAFIFSNPVVLILAFALSLAVILLNIPWVISRLQHPSAEVGVVRRGQLLGASLIVLLVLGVPVYNGGDHFVLFRFYQVAWPLLIIPFLWFGNIFTVTVAPQVRVILMIVFIGVLLGSPRVSWFRNFPDYEMHVEFNVAVEGLATASELNNMFAGSPPSAGIIAAGGFGLAYNGPVVDVVGLNNTEVAHAPGNRYGLKNHASFNSEIFLKQNPVFFLPEKEAFSEGSGCHEIFTETLTFPNTVLNGLLDEERFWKSYDRVLLSNDEGRVITYISRDQINNVMARGIDTQSLSCWPQ